MSEETTQATGANGQNSPEPGASGQQNANTDAAQSNPQDLQNSLNASRRRETEANKALEESNKRLVALEKAEQKRKQAEMTELEKAQTAAAEAQRKADELNTYKERWESYEKRQAERVTKELEGLTDQQKAIVEKLADTDDQLEAITQFKATQAGRLDVAGGAGARTTNKPVSQLNKEELAAEFEKYNKGAS